MKIYIKELVLNRELVLTTILIGAAVVAPLLHSQLVTGTLVNTALFAAVMLAGFRAACAVAVIPSLIALAVGTLPWVMAPMIPFIMASNIVLAGTFALLHKVNYWLAAISASALKFGFLVLGANVVLVAMTHVQMTAALASMMGWPQLITAVLGSILAWVICERISLDRE
jgi:hypothetical protein